MLTSCGMAAAFLAMNDIYGNVFQVVPAEAREPELMLARAQTLAGQFIFDVQTHFVRDDFNHDELLGLGKFAERALEPEDEGGGRLLACPLQVPELREGDLLRQRHQPGAVERAAPFDDPSWRGSCPTSRSLKARELINDFAGSRRLLAHSVITPKQPGWMDEVDKAIAVYQPESWKGYTIGDPLNPSKFPWRLDDEALMYPFYEKAVKAGIPTLCIHKGLLPPDYEKSFGGVWEYATAWDIGKAAKDWPQMNFVIYHSALQGVSRTAGPGVGGVRADRPHPLGQRSGGDPTEVRRHQRLCRARHGVCQLGGGASKVLRRAGRYADQRHGSRPRHVGHRLGLVRAHRNGKSRRCAGSEIPDDMQKKYGCLRRSATPTAPPSS